MPVRREKLELTIPKQVRQVSHMCIVLESTSERKWVEKVRENLL